MAQHDYVIENANGAAVRADLNAVLLAIASINSGSTAPGTTYAYMLWTDTSVSPALIKMRNAANNAWITIGKADAALGHGDKDTANTWTKAQTVAQVALTDAATINTDATAGNVFGVTLAGNRTLANPTGLVAGETLVWFITQDATGGRTLTFGSLFKFAGGVVPSVARGANAVSRLSCTYNGAILSCDMGQDYR